MAWKVGFAHFNSPYFTLFDTAGIWSSTGASGIDGVARAVVYLATQNVYVVGNDIAPHLSVIDGDTLAATAVDTGETQDPWVIVANQDESRIYVGLEYSPFFTVYETATWTEIVPSPNPFSDDIRHLALSPNGKWLYVGGDSGQTTKAAILDADTLDVIQDLGKSSSSNGGAFSPDGAVLVSAHGSTLHIIRTSDWETTNLVSVAEIGTIKGVDFSPDGSLLAVGDDSFDGGAVLETATWTTVVNDIVLSSGGRPKFSPDGQYLAFTSNSSPNFDVFDVSNWSSVVGAGAGSLPNDGEAIVWVADNAAIGGFEPGMQLYSGTAEEAADSNVADGGATVPMQLFSGSGAFETPITIDQADVVFPMQTYAGDMQLELHADADSVFPMIEMDISAFGPLDVVETVGLGATLARFGWGFNYSSTLTLAATQELSVASMFISKMGMASSIDTKLRGGINLSDVIGLLDAEAISHVLSLSSTLGMGGTEAMQHLKVMALMSGMSLADVHTNQAAFSINLAAAMALRGLDIYGQDLELVSTVELTTMLETRYNAVIDAADILAMQSAQDMQTRMGMVFLSALSLEDSTENTARLNMDFFDAIEGEVIFNLGDDVYQGFVFSTDSAAFTEYSNYPFNSITEYREKPYGAADDGIYLLEGADDAGSPIEAAFKTKLTSFRERAIKDARAMYIGYTSSGELVLKASVVEKGVKKEHWFKAQYSGDSAFRTNRFVLPRGLRSTYWQFEVANVAGADFDIEDVTIMYEVLSRRIR